MQTSNRFHTIWLWLRNNETIRAGFCYAAILAILFGSVFFLGRSLQAPLYYPNGMTDYGAYGYEGPEPINTFSVEMATPSYYEWPTNILIGNIYKQGELPLWNPYQASGSPLAAQFSSRAFFPYQIAEDMSPVVTWDFFMLGRLFIAGLFTYLFLRQRNLSWISAFIGGIFYMFSGTFVWFINLEQFVNVAMVTPVLLWALEGLWHFHWGKGIPIAAGAVVLVLLAGQPETALYVLLMGTAYVIFRVFITPGAQKYRKLGLAATAGILGLLLAAPLIIPFLEFMPLSHSIHPTGGTMGTQDPTRLADLPQMFIPTFNEMETWYRYFPDNGRWDYLGGYTGILLPFLILAGLYLTFFRNARRWRSQFLFFTIFGLLIILKNFGSPIISWIGQLPVFDLAWTNRWAGPAWTFPLAIAGAYGFEMLREHAYESKSKRQSSIGHRLVGFLRNPETYGYFIVLALWVFIISVFIPETVAQYSDVIDSPYSIPSVVLGLVVGLAVLTTAIILIRSSLKTQAGWTAIVVLAILELWFAIPRGYIPETAVLKIIPFGLGLVIVLCAAYWDRLRNLLGKSTPYRFAAVGTALLIFLVPTLAIDVTAPNAFPSRYDASTQPPYVEFLKNQAGYYRATGGDGALFPNFAETIGIMDVHYILALSVESFQNFKDENLHIDTLSAPGGPVLWFTGGPEREIEGPAGYGIRIYRNHWEDINGKLPFYSLLGVKYIVTPKVPDVQPENYLKNGKFDLWQRGAGPFTKDGEITADNWEIDLYGDSNIKVSQNTQDTGLNARYSMQIDYELNKLPPSYVQQVFQNPTELMGKTLTFSAQVKTDTPEAVRLGISDPVSGPSWSVSHPSGDQWYTLTVTHTVPAFGVTNVSVLIQMSSTATVIVSNAFLFEGTDPYQSYAPMLTKGFPLVYNNEVAIYENPDAFPRAFVVQNVKSVNSLAEAQRVIRSPEFDLRNEITLEEALPDGFTLAPEANSTAEIIVNEANKVVVQANMDKPGVLVLTDVFYPGWKATVDGKSMNILRVDGVFRGLALEEGAHSIVFTYFPDSFVRGLMLSFAGIFMCIGLFVFALLRKRPKSVNVKKTGSPNK